MLIDCATCPGRGHGCGQCVVGVMHHLPSVPVDHTRDEAGDPPLPLDAAERAAVRVFLDAGLLSPEATVGLFASAEYARGGGLALALSC